MENSFVPNSFLPISFLPIKPTLQPMLQHRPATATSALYTFFSVALVAIALAAMPTTDALAASSSLTTRAELSAYCHEYVLNDGRVLSVYRRGQRFFAAFDRHPGHEIFAVAPAVFDMPTKHLSLSFAQGANGVVTDVSLTPTSFATSSATAQK
jgi:hypothetical protein